jgi:hypothetical protein
MRISTQVFNFARAGALRNNEIQDLDITLIQPIFTNGCKTIKTKTKKK